MNFGEDISELMSRKEELCDELKRCIVKESSFTSLKHPLVYAVPYFGDAMNAFYNKQLQVKRDAVQEAIADKNWHTVIWMHERPYRMHAFDMYVKYPLFKEQKFSTMWEILREIWIDSENIWQHFHEWWMLFTDRSRIGKTRSKMMTRQERKALEGMPDVITVYRGCQKGVNEQGFSYTLDKEKAEWFANRFKRKGSRPIVIAKEINKSQVIAYLTGRDEEEIILLPQ